MNDALAGYWESASPWKASSPGVWDRTVRGDLWTLSVLQKGSVRFATLTGPHPAPTWTTGDRDSQGAEHFMTLADDRIKKHYAID